jgi:hypothetical protein
VPIERRNSCVYATLGTCYSVWMTVCIPDSHPHRITNTKCRINIVVSPDDGHIVARNVEIDKYTDVISVLIFFSQLNRAS